MAAWTPRSGGGSWDSSSASTPCAWRRPRNRATPRRPCPPPTSWLCSWTGTCATTSTRRRSPTNDRLIFSKGHASTLVYAIFRAAGALSEDELLTYRKHGSPLEGHPTPVLPWVDVATGSLGQGLPIGVGTALAAKYLDRVPARTWVLCGDSEMAEGSIWEAFEHGGALRARQPDRDRRRQPPGSAWGDDGRLGSRPLCRASAGVRVACDPGRRARRGGRRPRVRRGARDQGQADGDRRADDQGQGRRRGRGRERVPRQAARRP